MLYETLNKKIKILMIEEEINIKDISEKLKESPQNVNQKIGRKTIRLMDAERVLDVLGYKLSIEKKS